MLTNKHQVLANMATNINLPRILGIPVPPMLEGSLGYDGDQRYVGVWETIDSHKGVRCYDGLSIAPSNDVIWKTYIRHVTVEPYLSYYDFNMSHQSTHILILDRRYRRIYVEHIGQGIFFLESVIHQKVEWRDATERHNFTDELSVTYDISLNRTLDWLSVLIAWLDRIKLMEE